MAAVFVRSVLKVCVAQICQNMGWNAVQATPLDLLVDILHRYLEELSKTCHRYTEQFGRTEPNLDDLGLAFKDIGIPLGELEDFINNVEPVPFVHPLPLFPVPRSNNLQIPKEGSREVAQRPEWIHEFLPLMYPEAEEEEYVSSPLASVDGMMRSSIGNNEGGTSMDSPRMSLKRPLDIEAMMQTPKRARPWTEDEGRPMREMTSVVMTSQGVIFSPMQEGKLPDARTPSKIAGDDSRPSSPCTPVASVSETKKDVKKEPKKDIKKDSKKDDKKLKDKKDKKDMKKKDGKKDKKENKENKKKDKSKSKPKESLESKDTKSKSSVKISHHVPKGVHIDCKTKKIVPGKSLHSKSSKIKINKIKPTKLKQSKLKPFLAKSSKNKGNKFGETLKLLKTKPKKKPKVPLSHLSAPVRLITKSPVRAKSPKQEPLPPIQLPPVIPKSIPIMQEVEREIIPPPLPPPEPPLDLNEKVIPQIETPEPFSPEDSPERLVIDDNPETIARQERESRMQALNDSIDAAIQRGMEEAKLEEQEACRKEQETNRTVDETIDEVVRMSSLKVKTEPRDIYDFTDDESSLPATPATPRTPEVTSPLKKKAKKESPEVSGKKVKEKIKEKIKQKSKEPKSKSRSPAINTTKVVIKSEPVEEPERPKTPEPQTGSSDQESPASFPSPFPKPPGFPWYSAHLPYFSQFRHIPPALLPYPSPPSLSPQFQQQFQPHAPPNMPMPPMGFYVRTPKNDNSNVKNSTAPNPATPSSFAAAISAPDKAEDLAFKVKQEKAEEVPSFPEKLEKAKSKEHKKEKKEKEKEKDKKEKDKEKEKEKEKPKTKKKKEKAKEKEKKNPEKEKEKLKPKIKEKEKNIKDKGKDKEKVKSVKKEKEKKKEKKEEKNKDEKESGGSPNASGIPKITFKLGNSSAQEIPKIVIKPMKAQEESRSPSPVKESTSPPPLSTQKSHPKPQIKVNPVPPAPKPTPGPASQSSAPACTVITETVGTIIDEEGNKIWICPACTRPDDGSPMIGCDECDDWYHWVCMGIVVPPKEEENWFCTRCITKKQSMQKKKKKKHRKDKTPL